MEAALGFLLFLVAQTLLLVVNFLFIFAWNHSLTELWPNVVSHVGYWQGYLILTVFNLVFPYRVTLTHKSE